MTGLRQTLRALWRDRRLTAVIVACLALGIAANVTIFSVCEALLLRPLPGVTGADRLVTLIPRTVRVPGLAVAVRSSLSIDDVDRLQQATRALSSVAVAQSLPLSLAAGDLALRVDSQFVNPDFFSTLGTRCAPGRCLSADADLRGRQTAVLADSLWRSVFGGRPDALGRIVQINGEPFEVIGIAPPGFRGAQRDERPEIWLPLHFAAAVMPAMNKGRFESKRWITHLAGRLAPGVSSVQAQRDVDAIFGNAAAATADQPSLEVHPGLGIEPEKQTRILRPLTLLFAFGAILLLAIWANVAGLLLGRTLARLDELGMRQALGARRSRLARQLFGESLVLALIAGAAGSALAVVALRLLEGTAVGESFPALLDLRLDGRVVVLALGLSLLSALVIAAVPIWYSGRWDLGSMLRARRVGGVSATGRRQMRLYDLFVVGQLAASMVLLIATGLLVQSFRHLAALDLGFAATGVVHCRVDLAPQRLQPAAARDVFSQLLDRARHLRGVRAAALARSLPFDSGHTERGLLDVAPEEAGPGSGAARYLVYNAVSPGYFQTLHIPLRQGRDFASSSAGDSSTAVVIDEAMARAFWPNAQPLGRRLLIGGKPRQVIGIVGPIRQDGRGQPSSPYLYLPLDDHPALALVLRVDGPPGPILAALRGDLRRLAPAAPLYAIGRLQDDVAASLAQIHLLSRLLAAYGAAALLLAALGLYGALMHLVRVQTRDLGIRMALGARREALLARTLGRGLLLTAAGLLAGALLATALGRLIAGLLYGIAPSDPAVILAAAAVLLAIGACASSLPALAATRLDPAATMRAE
jgi:predicted permease